MLSMPRIVRPDPFRARGTEVGFPAEPALADPLSETKNCRKFLPGKSARQVRQGITQRAGVTTNDAWDSALDLPTPPRPGSKLEMQMLLMATVTQEKTSLLDSQTAKDWAPAWDSAEVR